MIDIKDLNLRLKKFALKDISLTVKEGALFILVGPSGSGKTVLLETVAGLRRHDRGKIVIGGNDVSALEPERRGIGMVYQDCALFPHLNVRENISFGLRIRRKPPSHIEEELCRVKEIFSISHLMESMPGDLSGGEKQKVALARAMVTHPRVLLLDEPLSSLDPQTKEGVRQEIMKLNRHSGITIINVTHDFEEALSMGTEVAVMGNGRIRQVGSPSEVFQRPSSKFVAEFTMATNIFLGVVQEEGGKRIFSFSGGRLETDSDVIGKCYASIRPENIDIYAFMEGENKTNVVPATVKEIVDRGFIVNIVAEAPPYFTLLATRQTVDAMGIKLGQKINLSIPKGVIALFKDERSWSDSR